MLRDEIAKKLRYFRLDEEGYDGLPNEAKDVWRKKADQILNLKINNHTLKELEELKDRLALLSENQEKPECPIKPDPRLIDFEFQLAEKSGYQKSQEDMSDFKRVEELI